MNMNKSTIITLLLSLVAMARWLGRGIPSGFRCGTCRPKCPYRC